MRDMVVISSEVDVASTNIRDRMLELGTFKKVATLDGLPVYEGHGGHLLSISGDALYRNNLDAEVLNLLDVRPRGIIYLSRHSSKSGARSLTVHPIGNFSHARYGGYFRQLVHSFPGAMTAALRRMHQLAREASLDYAVSFEVTHHGPYLNTPTFFIEIGSDERAWRDRRAAEVLARTVLELESDGCHPVVLGVGGGHYAPRHTDVALKKAVCYSHIIPTHALAGLGSLILDEMLDYICESRLVYFHRKAIRGEELRRLKAFFEERGMSVVRERDLPDLVCEAPG